MWRLFTITIFLLIAAFFHLGMEGLGSSEKFPEPELDYRATVTDLEMVEHHVKNVSINGKTSLTGFRGKASVTVDFSRISQAQVSPGDKKAFVNVHLVLRDGRKVELRVNGLSRCYGVTDLGQTSVRMRDIKSIVFAQELPESKDK